ncbi:MAG TPA: hypothetical protein VF653_12440, partial [Methylomirabilota bacterium]
PGPPAEPPISEVLMALRRPESRSPGPEGPSFDLLGGRMVETAPGRSYGPADPLAHLGILDPSQQPPFELQGPTFRRTAATDLMPPIGEPPAAAAPGPYGITEGPFPEPVPRQSPRLAPQGGGEMDPERRLELMKAARMFREAGSQFRNITGESEMWLRGGNVPDRSVVAEDLRADEERLRRGDFENPRSPASQMARQMLSQATGKPVPETMTASAIAALSPVFDRLITGQLRGFGQSLALSREERARRGEERHLSERREDIQRGREKELRAAISGERKEMLSPTGQLGKYREGIEMTDKALALLEQGGPQAFGTALSLIIKGIGKEAGNIAQKEREVLLGEIGIPGLVTKGVKAWTGDYTPEQYAAMKNVARKARELLERDRTAHRSQRLDTFYSTHRELLDESGIDRGALEERLGLGGEASGPAGATQPGGPASRGQGGKVKVVPVGETDAIWVDAADVERGIREGIWERTGG